MSTDEDQVRKVTELSADIWRRVKMGVKDGMPPTSVAMALGTVCAHVIRSSTLTPKYFCELITAFVERANSPPPKH